MKRRVMAIIATSLLAGCLSIAQVVAPPAHAATRSSAHTAKVHIHNSKHNQHPQQNHQTQHNQHPQQNHQTQHNQQAHQPQPQQTQQNQQTQQAQQAQSQQTQQTQTSQSQQSKPLPLH